MKRKNDEKWERLFEKYNILEQINTTGDFLISANQIREFREPRLMTKFDHTVNLPKVFVDHQLAILPVTRGDYKISHFDAYHKLEGCGSSVKHMPLPSYIQSLDANNISSEAIALNCALVSGIVADFLDDEDLVPTVSGRMSSGTFSYSINLKSKRPYRVSVNNSQIEIDGAYEGIRGLALVEAKRDLSEDFLVRQLYYPYRIWQERITKNVRPLFLVYSNGIYHLYEYMFQELNNYNSLVIVKQKNYSIEDTAITVADIQAVLATTGVVVEPRIPFPQADSFERVINLCELLSGQELSQDDVTEQYAFDARQTNYYTDAARYLGLVEKEHDENNVPIYSLSTSGKRILKQGYKQRQLAYCKIILSHKAFADTLRKCLNSGNVPSKAEIVQIMKDSNLYNVQSESTFGRRSSTIKGWINWILGLINE